MLLQLTRVAPLLSRLKELLAEHELSLDNVQQDHDEEAEEEAETLGDEHGERSGRAGKVMDASPEAPASASSSSQQQHSDSSTGITQMAALLGDAQYAHTQAVQPVGVFDSELPFTCGQTELIEGDDDDEVMGASSSSATRAASSAAGAAGARGLDAASTSGKRRSRRRRNGYTFDELLSLVQASPQELRDGIAAIPSAICMKDDVYRLLSDDLVGTILAALVKESEDSGYALDAIPSAALVDALEYMYPLAVSAHVLRLHSSPLPPGDEACAAEEGGGVVSLLFAPVAVTRGLRLLRPASLSGKSAQSSRRKLQQTSAAEEEQHQHSVCRMPGVNVGEGWVPVSAFMSAWASAMPTALLQRAASPPPTEAAASTSAASSGSLSLSLLSGNILVETSPLTGQQIVRFFASDSLSADPATRFQQLFAVRQRWTLGE